MSDKFQNDFFGEAYREKRGMKPDFLDKYSKHRFLPHIKIPTEYAVIIAIGVLILVIIAYAVGVERGKRIQPAPAKKIETREAQVLVNEGVAEIDEPEARRLPEPKEEAVPVAEEGVYDIQLASFKNLRLAKKEVATLRRKGFEASYAQRGSWYQVYVTGYRTVEDAQEAKKKLAKSYKDCYIRKAK